MANCPPLSTEDGKLVLSTNATTEGTFVVIGCTGFGRQKTAPYNALCASGSWSPAPTTDCETSLDERERLLLGVLIGCGVLSLIVLFLLCCSCCFYSKNRKPNRWWGTRYSGDRIIINRGTQRFSSFPRETIIRREIIRPRYDDYGSQRSFGRSMRRSRGVDRIRSSYRRDDDDFRSERSFGRSRRYSSGFERQGSFEGRHGKTEVYTRNAYLPDYDFFLNKTINRKSEGEFIDKGRRYSDGGFDRPHSEYKRTRRYSAGSGGYDMMRTTRQYVTSTKPSYIESYETAPAVQYRTVQYEQESVQPILEPIVHYDYIEQPIQYVEKPINLSSSYMVPGGIVNPVVYDDDEVIMKYDKFGTSFSTLPKANITELPGDSDMQMVPYRSSKNMDPTSYFLGQSDNRYDSWYA